MFFIKTSKKEFTPLEESILTAFKSAMPFSMQCMLDAQMASINYIQRFMGDKEINFYCMKKGKPQHFADIRLPINQEQVKAARVTFRCGVSSEVFKADIWIVNGYLFSITVNKPIKAIQHSSEIYIDNVEKYELFDDVELKGSFLPDDDSAVKWLESSKLGLYSISEVSCAYPDEIREAKINKIEAKLPADFLQLTEQVDSFCVENWRFLGLRAIRYVVLDECNVYVLAESEDCDLMVIKEDDKEGMLYLIKHDSDQMSKLCNSLIGAFNLIINKEKI